MWLPETGFPFVYPEMDLADVEQLLLGDEPLSDDEAIATNFARDVLDMDGPLTVSQAAVTGSAMGYVIEDAFLRGNVWMQILARRATGEPLWVVTSATTFQSDPEFYLSASIGDESGVWTASFSFPPLGQTALVTYASGTWVVSDVTTVGEITLTLPQEPLETARLTITFVTPARVVGFHGILLPAGRFAAG